MLLLVSTSELFQRVFSTSAIIVKCQMTGSYLYPPFAFGGIDKAVHFARFMLIDEVEKDFTGERRLCRAYDKDCCFTIKEVKRMIAQGEGRTLERLDSK